MKKSLVLLSLMCLSCSSSTEPKPTPVYKCAMISNITNYDITVKFVGASTKTMEVKADEALMFITDTVYYAELLGDTVHFVDSNYKPMYYAPTADTIYAETGRDFPDCYLLYLR